jgi:hypothetical protein
MTAPRKPPYVAAFDSATAMAMALGRFLHGRDFPGLGQPRYLRPVVAAADLVPRRLRTWLFSVAGAREGVRPEEIERVDGAAIADWLAALPPRRRYPAAMIGSSSGALVHLAAALGVPWLPQTVLVPVRRDRPGDPDDAAESLRVGTPLGERLLAVSPDLQLHHMHDPNQDRLMVRRMMYFRLKWRRLPAAYRAFLAEALPPGGTIVVADCRQSWATTRVGERHVFQHGAVGGATEEDYLEGSPRVAGLLARVGAGRERWPSPAADGRSPEAEWGFERALLDDIGELARARGWKVVRLACDDPAQLSPPVADLYRGWNARRGLAESRLLVESFILLDPYWCLRPGAAPFWMTFNMEPSARRLERFLDERPPFDEIHLTLFAHGADSVGLPAIGRWRSLAARARRDGRLAAVDETAYPAHFAVFARYNAALRRLPRRHPLPPSLALEPTLAALADSPRLRVELLGR